HLLERVLVVGEAEGGLARLHLVLEQVPRQLRVRGQRVVVEAGLHLLQRGQAPGELALGSGTGHVVELGVAVLAPEEGHADRAELQLLLVLALEPGIEACGFGGGFGFALARGRLLGGGLGVRQRQRRVRGKQGEGQGGYGEGAAHGDLRRSAGMGSREGRSCTRGVRGAPCRKVGPGRGARRKAALWPPFVTWAYTQALTPALTP